MWLSPASFWFVEELRMEVRAAGVFGVWELLRYHESLCLLRTFSRRSEGGPGWSLGRRGYSL